MVSNDRNFSHVVPVFETDRNSISFFDRLQECRKEKTILAQRRNLIRWTQRS